VNRGERLRHALGLAGAVFGFLIVSHIFIPFGWMIAVAAIRWVFTGDGFVITDHGPITTGPSPVWPFFLLFVLLCGVAIALFERARNRRLEKKYSQPIASSSDVDD
jgi:hypothetical protein